MNSSNSSFDEDRLVAAVKEFTRELERDAQLSPEAFLVRFPDLENALRPVLEGLMLVHGAGGNIAPIVFDAEYPGVADAEYTGVADTEYTAKPIGDFQIISELGRGGMGVVYEAVQLSLGRRVALKVLPFASGLDEVRLQRFRNEAHAAAALHHTNIVPVYAVGCDRGLHYYAMQLIEGQTLAEVIDELRGSNLAAANQSTLHGGNASTTTRHRSLSTAKSSQRTNANRIQHYRLAASMICQAAQAIEHAHQYGVIHRDVKPGNLMRDVVGKLWVTDFGLAQIESDALQLTRTGDPMGTLRYMSPEQATGDRTLMDHRTDIYSLGATLYELLVLQPAFTSNNYRQLLNDVVEKEPPPPSSIEPELPSELDTIVRTAMAKAPAERYSSALAFANDLQSWLDDKPISARPANLLERASKWRRRNSGLVAMAGVLLSISTAVLSATTLFVWYQRDITQRALEAERNQRMQAELSFQQARVAVDTFSELSERELANRPDLQGVRRQFLETSLGFYESFLAQRSSDLEVSEELKATTERVERIVEELRILDDVQPLLQLTDRRVRQDLELNGDAERELLQLLSSFDSTWRELSDGFGMSVANNEPMLDVLRNFEDAVSKVLSDLQRQRLRQIQRQRWLPFTFTTREVVEALQLTKDQQQNVARIIVETRPEPHRGFGGGKRGGGRSSGERNGGEHRPAEFSGFNFPPPNEPGPPGRPANEPFGPPRNGLPRDGIPRDGRPPHDDNFGGNFGGVGYGFMLESVPTVRAIEKILTPEQLAKWQSLIGKPFLP